MQVRTRVAPSPTGRLHIGTAHTALFNWLVARHYGGEFIMRIDDSDPKRNKSEYEENIIRNLKWLNIDWNEGPDIGGPYGPYRQSERMELYWSYVERLLREGAAYYCYCTPEELEQERKMQAKQGKTPRYSERCRDLSEQQKVRFEKNGRKPAVRLKVRDGEVRFTDKIRGEIVVKTKEIGDFVIARSDKSSLLVMATTVDDIEMQITHTIRGEDFINLIPRQILIYEALKETQPIFANLSFIYGPDGSKLSKRHGATSVEGLRKEGFLPEAIVNYLVLLGWSPKDDREILKIDEVIKLFKLKDVQEAGPRFDYTKLKWINGVYLRNKNSEEFTELMVKSIPEKEVEKYEITTTSLKEIAPLIQERIKLLSEVWEYIDFFFSRPDEYEIDLSPFGGCLRAIARGYEDVEQWNHNNLYKLTKEAVGKREESNKKLFMSLRIAVTGKKIGPPLFESMEFLGKEETLKRLRAVIK